MPCHRKATLLNVSLLPNYKVPAFAVLFDGRLFKSPSTTSKGYVRPQQIYQYFIRFQPHFSAQLNINLQKKKEQKNRRYAVATLEH